MGTVMTSLAAPKKVSVTLAHQSKLPKLPIPPLEDTCRRYLRALEALQDPEEHEATKKAVEEFLEKDGPALNEQLKVWAENKARYARKRTSLLFRLISSVNGSSFIEDFWYV
jgi:carnitine O-acetyltransferase